MSLLANSPLLDVPGCGLVGAKGIGCGLTATLLHAFRAEPRETGVRISWELYRSTSPSRSWAERSVGSVGPWENVTAAIELDGRGFAQFDEDVEPGSTYWYRIGWLADGAVQHSQVASVAVAAIDAGRFSVRPNPSHSFVDIAWTQNEPHEAIVRVYDLSGRSIATLAQGPHAAGRHEVRWSGYRKDGSPAPTGWYIARVTGPLGATRRFLLMR